MSLGKNKSKVTKLDNFIEQLNLVLGRLLGKREKQPIRPEETSNSRFSVIILLSCLLLWFCTGFYFLEENKYGLIFINGKVVDVKHGVMVGMSLPYPFGNVQIIDGAVKNISIGANAANEFIVLDQNLAHISITTKFNYQITRPRILFLNHLQDTDDLDKEIIWQVQGKIRQFIAKTDITQLKATNLTVLSNEISKIISPTLEVYGISLLKFSVLDIHLQDIKSDTIVMPKTVSSGDIKSKKPSLQRFGREVNRDRTWMGD